MVAIKLGIKTSKEILALLQKYPLKKHAHSREIYFGLGLLKIHKNIRFSQMVEHGTRLRMQVLNLDHHTHCSLEKNLIEKEGERSSISRTGPKKNLTITFHIVKKSVS